MKQLFHLVWIILIFSSCGNNDDVAFRSLEEHTSESVSRRSHLARKAHVIQHSHKMLTDKFAEQGKLFFR